ncbi:hypothetical protein OKW30_005953 [Paraburkholderia sp. Clong3]
MGLLLEDEADCLNHQHKRRRHWPPIRRQRRAAAPYRASGLVHSAIPDVQVSHLSGSNESLCRHSHFGGGERQLPLQPNAYLRPATDLRIHIANVRCCSYMRRSPMGRRLPLIG